MKDKRISLRFRADNERDMEAWKMLEKMAQKKNASKNSVAIELILSGSTKRNADDVLAHQNMAQKPVSGVFIIGLDAE